MAENTGFLNHLDTDAMYAAVQAYDNAVRVYEKSANDMKRIIERVLGTWEGIGRDEFEKDYRTFAFQLSDLMDVLMDLRKGLVDAETTFIETDAEIGKEIACSQEKEG